LSSGYEIGTDGSAESGDTANARCIAK
jgi:hypothetical protein